MPHEEGPRLAFRADADLRTKQFFIVKLTGDNQVGLPTAATDTALGVLQNKPNAGEAAAVWVAAGSRVSAAVDSTTDIVAGDFLGINSSGVLVKKTTADFTVCALALEASTTNGVETHDVFWLGVQPFRAAAG